MKATRLPLTPKSLSPTRLELLKNTEPSALIAITRSSTKGFPPLRNLARLPVPAL